MVNELLVNEIPDKTTKFNVEEASIFTDEQIAKMPGHIFILNKRGKSGYVKEGHDPKNPKSPQLDSALTFTLPNPSKMWIGRAKGGWVDIMYIEGAPTIFVKTARDADGKVIRYGLDHYNYDLKEAIKQYKMNPVMFRKGMLNLADYSSPVNLVQFVMNHQFNVDRPGFQDISRQFARDLNANFTFKIKNKVKQAVKSIDYHQANHEANRMVYDLSKKVGNEYIYDTIRMDAYLSIFGVGGKSSELSAQEKMAVIIESFAKNAIKTKQIIEDEMEEYKLTIASGKKFDVLKISKTGARFADEKADFCSFNEKSEFTYADSELLVYYFMSSAGVSSYEKLEAKVLDASIAAAKA